MYHALPTDVRSARNNGRPTEAIRDSDWENDYFSARDFHGGRIHENHAEAP
jgi:hypothetical protein